MLQRCLRFHPSLRIPYKAPRNEVNKVIVLAPQNLGKRFCAWSSTTTLRVHHGSGCAIVIEEESLSGATIDEVLIWGPQNLHDTRQLLLLIFTRKDRESRIELGEDATQTPHVNSHVIVHAQDNFRRPIETALDISIDLLML